MKTLPTDRHITLQLQYRKCGKKNCRICQTSKGHGGYWYGYYHADNGKLKSIYIGKTLPGEGA